MSYQIKAFLLTTCLSAAMFSVHAQDAAMPDSSVRHWQPSFQKKTTLVSVSFGIDSWNKRHYTLPDSFKYGAGAASVPIYIRLERAISNSIGIGAMVSYNAFTYTYDKQIFFNGATEYRLFSDKFSVVSFGPALHYHFGQLLKVKRLDAFVTLGGALNFISHSNYPSADTFKSAISTTGAIVIRLGARYYISRHTSFFGDIGYDQTSLLSLGFSYRFFDKAKAQTASMQ